MRESTFIRQNKDNWKEFEKVLEQEKDPDKIRDLYIQLSDDLSYARTFYPNRSVRVYLNNLTKRVFFSVYKNKKREKPRFYFWTDELPLLMYEARWSLLFSFFLFGLSFGIGMLSAAMDPAFAEVILGQDYVQMTVKNIESGDPMAVYKERGAFGMALGITFNNLLVALLTFASGVFFSIGTIGLLIRNGVMVGVFQYFFIERDLFQESFLTIWTHGTLEISAIIIAGAAGIAMGRGIVFPGTLSRMKAFQLAVRRGIKMMMGIVPIIVMAGIIESYLTRYTETPDGVRLAFILLCLAFVLFYFVWYPRFKFLHQGKGVQLGRPLPPDTKQEVDLGLIKPVGDLFTDTFIFFRQHAWPTLRVCLLAALLFCAAIFLPSGKAPASLFNFPQDELATLFNLPQFFRHPDLWWITPVHLLLFTLVSGQVIWLLLSYESQQSAVYALRMPRVRQLSVTVKLLTGGAALAALLFTVQWFTWFVVAVGFPILLLWMYIMIREEKTVPKALGRLFSLIGGQLDKLIGLGFSLTLIGSMAFLLLDTLVSWLLFETIGLNFSLDQTLMDNLTVVFLTGVTMFVLYTVFAILMIGAGLAYYSLLEIKEARFLKAKLAKLSLSRRIQGLEKET